eukprot:TRINITY_DN28107_c0_g1_i1.p1 TRINITY_DN28107_c0_g1~~TRINITY_DN28107_c0_g1_i1.p1  ORF type:complete len:360 (-),score=73.46 TRINITY_DN28107_c0_g1_i1:265-1344(-)
MRRMLNDCLGKEPGKMGDLIQKFKSWDKNGDGYITRDELKENFSELCAFAWADGVVTKDEAAQLAQAEEMVENFIEEADQDGDGRIDMWEAMAHALGRRKMPVEILLYDISNGVAQALGPLLLGRKAEAVHSGVLVYGSEYWYGGKILRTDPPCRQAFGEPLTTPWGERLVMSEQRPDLPVVRAGYTFVTHEEFKKYLLAHVCPRYTGIEQYDLLTHSCNHFTDEVLKFLTGEGIPSRILELQRSFVTGPVLRLRPYLNRYLGGFGDAEKEVTESQQCQQYLKKDTQPYSLTGSPTEACSWVLGTGDVVLVEGVDEAPVVATIIGRSGETCEIKYFCIEQNAIATKSGIPLHAVQAVSV